MMNDLDLDPEVRYTARRVAQLTADVETDSWHQAALRAQLMRRHQELVAAAGKRSLTERWIQLFRLHRLTMLGSPVVALTVAFSVLLWTLQLSGHPAPRTAA